MPASFVHTATMTKLSLWLLPALAFAAAAQTPSSSAMGGVGDEHDFSTNPALYQVCAIAVLARRPRGGDNRLIFGRKLRFWSADPAGLCHCPNRKRSSSRAPSRRWSANTIAIITASRNSSRGHIDSRPSRAPTFWRRSRSPSQTNASMSGSSRASMASTPLSPSTTATSTLAWSRSRSCLRPSDQEVRNRSVGEMANRRLLQTQSLRG
ncbi:uncharacterized protein BJ171DRAFT_248702 [Polychytrium aggregatum]|uniref:uncharacterized protein n=1 Tax=Polychytrium aggregatum TaxID=110093 RepID=UPI0022FE8B4F|nr:uncharacterized protein BJ171DRAFT_248702 [Polychytrium aggregatum]KAI9193718.1 hypothetical protein BJ171DRAFT_248702 [Polychytrium aggregatum]